MKAKVRERWPWNEIVGAWNSNQPGGLMPGAGCCFIFRRLLAQRLFCQMTFISFVVLVAGCVGSKATPPSVMTEEYAVYGTVIESLYLAEGIELIVIKDHTATDLSSGETLDSAMEYVQENVGQVIDSETVNDYKVKNRQPQELDRLFSLDVEYVLLSEAEFNEIFEAGDGWSQFNATYLEAQGVMTLSKVGFNAKMNQALVYVGNRADFGSGEGFYVFLTREKGIWIIHSTILSWIS